jgi:methionyl-tRNA formyltransferase
VAHESDLPQGRGFSPLSWQVLAGASEIPMCLIEMVEDVDAGPIVGRAVMKFAGHELIDELRKVQGETTLALCRAYLDSSKLPQGKAQAGNASVFPRRRPADSELDPRQSLEAQFALLRIVDNQKYPAFFDLNGHRYRLAIEKFPNNDV